MTPLQSAAASRAGISREMTVARWLFDPFVRIGGVHALVIGLSLVVVTGLVAAAAGVHFDGLLDFHPGYGVSFWVPVLEGLVNWSVISLLLSSILLVAPRTVRFVDIVGMQALARWPLLPASLASLPPAVRQGNEALLAAAIEGRLVMPRATTLVANLFAAGCGVWMVWLMWRAFAVACNQRGARGAAMFAVALAGGEMVTKFVFRQATVLLGVLLLALGGTASVAAQMKEVGPRGEVQACRDGALQPGRTAQACGHVQTGKWMKKWGTMLGVAATLGLSVVAARTGNGKAIAAVGVSAGVTPALAAVGSELEARGYRELLHLQDEQLRRAGQAGTIGLAYRVTW